MSDFFQYIANRRKPIYKYRLDTVLEVPVSMGFRRPKALCRIPSEARVLRSRRASKSHRNGPKQCLTNF